MWSAFGVEASACTFPHGRDGLDPRKDHHRIARQPCVFPAHREKNVPLDKAPSRVLIYYYGVTEE